MKEKDVLYDLCIEFSEVYRDTFLMLKDIEVESDFLDEDISSLELPYEFTTSTPIEDKGREWKVDFYRINLTHRDAGGIPIQGNRWSISIEKKFGGAIRATLNVCEEFYNNFYDEEKEKMKEKILNKMERLRKIRRKMYKYVAINPNI